METSTGLTLIVTSNGSSHGLEDLLAGKADVGMISSTLDVMAKKVPGTEVLKAQQVGTGRVAFLTNKDNKVTKLTLDQVKAILLGQTKNWSEIGGDDKPIIIIAEYKDGGIRSTVEKELLEGQPFAGQLKELPNGTQVAKVSGQVPGAFGVASSATADGTVLVIETDKNLEQPLILVTKGDASANAQKLIDAAKALNIK